MATHPSATLSSTPSVTTPEEAIAQVLRHERAAQAAIESARHQALQIAEAVRADARAIAARTDSRIRRALEAFEQHTRACTAALDEEAAAMAQPPAPTAQDQERLDRAVQALADELTGVVP